MDSVKENKKKFNCFVYALGLEDDTDFTYSAGTSPRKRIESNHILRLIMDGILKSVEEKEKGDYILYRRNGKFTHMGKVCEENQIISKWGTEKGIVEHKPEDFFAEYGSDISYYKRVSQEDIKRALG